MQAKDTLLQLKIMKKLLILISVLLQMTQFAIANEGLHVSGFGNLGLVYSDSENYQFRTDISKYDDKMSPTQVNWDAISNLGIHFEYRVNNNIDAVAQFFYRGQDSFSFDDYTNLAFLRYRPTANWEIRAGRTALDIYLLAEYRDISFAYPWAKVPTEVYGLIPHRSLDGIDFTYHDQTQPFDYRIKFYTGHSSSQIGGLDYKEALTLEELFGVSLELSQLNWLVSIKHTQAKIDDNTQSTQLLTDQLNRIPDALWQNRESFINGFELAGKSARYTSIGARYDFDPLSIIGELSHLDGDSSIFRKVNSAYISTVYSLDRDQFFYSYGFTDTDTYRFEDQTLRLDLLPLETAQLIFAINESSNYFSSSQSTHSIGWRHDLSDNLAMKVQLDRTFIDQGGGSLWFFDGFLQTSPKEAVTAVFVSMSFTF